MFSFSALFPSWGKRRQLLQSLAALTLYLLHPSSQAVSSSSEAGTSIAVPVAAAPAVLPVGDTIDAVAGRLSIGKWAEVRAANMSHVVGNSGGSTGMHTVYADSMVWHRSGRRGYFIGGDHGAALRFLSYDATTSTWKELPRPTWASVPGARGSTGVHGYDHLALDEPRGLIYVRQFSGPVHRYRIASGEWSRLPALASSTSQTCCDALSFFPELDGVVWARASGEVLLYREASDSWTVLSKNLAKGGTWMFAEYNAVHKVVVFGNALQKAMYKLDARGKITRLRDPYVPIYDGSAFNGLFSVDPVSGAYLLMTATSRLLFSYDVSTDTWAEVPRGSRPDLRAWGLVAAPIHSAGVTLYAGCRRAGLCRLYLYRHDASTPPDTIAPRIELTPPSDIGASTGMVSLAAQASDNTGVAGVQFYVDAQPYGGEITKAPYRISLNTHWFSNGTHKIRARARDVAGNTVSTPDVSLIVSNSPTHDLLPANYAARCRARGVIRCYGFDDLADLTRGHPRLATKPVDSTSSRIYPPPADVAAKCGEGQCWQLDTVTRASGNGALRFEVPSNSPANSSGSFRLNFSDDLSQHIGEGEEFYVQYRQRFSPEMLRAFKAVKGVTAWKQSIVGLGDLPAGTATASGRTLANSCTSEEMVLVQSAHFMGPTFYHGCGHWTHMNYRVAAESQIRLQHVGAPYCFYPNDPTKGCFKYAPNEWMTFKLHVRIAGWGIMPHNRVRVWAAREGQRAVLIFDSSRSHPNGFPIHHTGTEGKFGKVWLLPYMTNKDPSEAHPKAHTWYDELIISREDIADPL